ncbi:MAG: cellulose synthase subunit BcsC-related outer membrane protein [Panacagrimonas sp.]
MKRVRSIFLGLHLAAGALAPMMVVAQADPAALKTLVEQGRFWDARDQLDRARQAWERVVTADPRNTEALSRLVAISMKSGNAAAARKYLESLRGVAPGSAALADAEKLLGGGTTAQRSESTPNLQALARARDATGRKDYPEALAAYREAFGGVPTSGPYALEYHQTLGATDEGWEPALAFMRQLAGKSPENPTIALALAQHMTYREKTRREGIDRLVQLQGNPVVGQTAQQSWRQALIWLQGSPADAARYRAYLAAAGDDPEVSRQLDNLSAASRSAASEAYGARIRGLFEQVDAGELAAAEAGFNELLAARPNNADALGGIGIVRLREQRYEESRNYLAQAQAASPARANRWADALKSATFWLNIQSAEKARLDGDFPLAETGFEAAFAAPIAEIPDAIRLAYVDVLLNRAREADAERIAREILSRDPGNADAMQALFTVLSRTNRYDEALQLAQKAPPELKPQVTALRAESLRRQAEAAKTAGHLAEAERLLGEALLDEPTNPWVRLDLAAIYRAQNKPAEAASLLDGLASTHGDRIEVRMAQAYLEADRKAWAEVLNRLQQFPPEARTPDARALQRRAWVQYQLQRAGQAMRQGQPGEAYRIMIDTDTTTAGDPELLAALAGGWAELRDPARAVAYMRKVMSLDNGATPSARIQYAAMLLSAQQDGEFEVVADDLARNTTLTAGQQAELDTLVVGYRVKLADRARERKDYAGAYVQLRDAIARYPADARVQMALARLLTDARDTDAAVLVYRGLVERDPDDEDARFGLIDALLAGNQLAAAQAEIDQGLRSYPDDPRWWRLSGRQAEQEGRRGAALAAYRRAERLGQTASGDQPPPQLAWIDSTQPDLNLPGPIIAVLTASAPDSLGPLTPRAASVALVAAPSASASSQAGPLPAAGAQTFASLEQDRQASLWRAPPVASVVLLKPETGQQAASKESGRPADARVAMAQSAGQTIERLESETGGWTGGLVAIRSRDGEGGLSQLFNIEVPVTWISRETELGRLSATITPVYLDAGDASGRRLLRLGTSALVNAEQDASTRDASGVALGLGYKFGNFEADIGATPIGFEEDRLVGGLGWSVSPGNLRLKLDLSRRAVSESLLAYAGAQDPLLGRPWGGVSRSGGRVDLAYDSGGFGLYSYLGYYTFDGRNVDTNYEALGGVGFFRRSAIAPNQTLTYGVNLTVFGFEENRRFFSFGHGGYFSPQLFTSLALPVQWSGNSGPLSWRLGASFGIQNFREDGAAFYPGFDALQQELERLARIEPDRELITGYESQRNSGLGYTVKGVTEYRMAARLSVGGLFSVDNARDFRELQAQGYIRYYFSGLPLTARDPEPIAPFYQY